MRAHSYCVCSTVLETCPEFSAASDSSIALSGHEPVARKLFSDSLPVVRS